MPKPQGGNRQVRLTLLEAPLAHGDVPEENKILKASQIVNIDNTAHLNDDNNKDGNDSLTLDRGFFSKKTNGE